MAKRASLHDAIECPHSGKEWHNLAVRLGRERDATASRVLGALLDAERRAVIADGLRGHGLQQATNA